MGTGNVRGGLAVNTGITDVYYKEEYRSNDGINFLKKTGVHVHKYITLETSV